MKLRGRFILSCTALALMGTGAALAGTQAGSLTAASRIVQPIDDSKLVTLAGSIPRQATPKNDRGAVADSFRLDHMYLRLQRSAQQEQALVRVAFVEVRATFDDGTGGLAAGV